MQSDWVSKYTLLSTGHFTDMISPDKSDAILLGTLQRSRTFASVRSVGVAGCSVLLSNKIKILGVSLDCHLSLDNYISSISKSAYYHIW